MSEQRDAEVHEGVLEAAYDRWWWPPYGLLLRATLAVGLLLISVNFF